MRVTSPVHAALVRPARWHRPDPGLDRQPGADHGATGRRGAGLVGGAIGAVSGLAGALGGKLLSAVGGRALRAVGGLFGRVGGKAVDGGASSAAESVATTATEDAASAGGDSAATSAADSAATSGSDSAAESGAEEAGGGAREEPSSSGKCETGPHSFVGSTPVLLADGTTKRIDQVKVGDKVTASVPGMHATETHTVENVIVTTSDRDFVDLTVAPVRAKSRAPKVAAVVLALAATLTTTFHHPFYDETKAAFVEAADVAAGDVLQTPTGTAVVQAKRAYHTDAVTYDLTIGGLHTYYVLAGSTPILVHNCTPKQAAADYRANPNNGVGGRRNVAVAQHDIDGVTGQHIGVSGNHPNPGAVPVPGNRAFDPGDRPLDAENQIFENYASHLDRDAQGTIDLYSEREVCPSCSSVIDQFHEMFPRIQVNVSWG